MIFYALHQVANLLCIEEMERHLHQLDQEIWNQGNVNSGIHMQQYPAPDKVHAELGDEKHELGDEDERDKVTFPVWNISLFSSWLLITKK